MYKATLHFSCRNDGNNEQNIRENEIKIRISDCKLKIDSGFASNTETCQRVALNAQQQRDFRNDFRYRHLLKSYHEPSVDDDLLWIGNCGQD